MSDLVIVLETTDDEANNLILRLGGHGLHPEIVDGVNANVTYWDRNSPTAHVAVPREEVGQARTLIQEWERRHESNADGLTRKLGGQLVLSIPAAVGVTAILGVAGMSGSNLMWLGFMIWVVAIIVISNWARITGSGGSRRKNEDRGAEVNAGECRDE